MSFNYPHTCPDIDASIKDTKNTIYDNIAEVVSECCPLLEGKIKDDFVKRWVDCMYQDLEHNYEGVRSSNQDMRSEAERQIVLLSDEIENLEYDISERDKKISELEYEIEELKSQSV